MNTRLLVKLNFLVLGFFVVAYLMYFINTYGLGKNMNLLLGIQPEVQKEHTRKASFK